MKFNFLVQNLAWRTYTIWGEILRVASDNATGCSFLRFETSFGCALAEGRLRFMTGCVWAGRKWRCVLCQPSFRPAEGRQRMYQFFIPPPPTLFGGGGGGWNFCQKRATLDKIYDGKCVDLTVWECDRFRSVCEYSLHVVAMIQKANSPSAERREPSAQEIWASIPPSQKMFFDFKFVNPQKVPLSIYCQLFVMWTYFFLKTDKKLQKIFNVNI